MTELKTKENRHKSNIFMLVAMYLMFNVCSSATIIIQVMITNVSQVQMEGII